VTKRVPTPEEITREYQQKLALAARAHYPNADLVRDWAAYTEPGLAASTKRGWPSFKKHLAE